MFYENTKTFCYHGQKKRIVSFARGNKNEFDDKILLNKNVAENMQMGETQAVRGTLVLEHDGKEYETKPKDLRFYELVEEKYPENSEGTIGENDITVNGTIYIATGLIPEPAITITSALTNHSSDNKISVSYQDFTKALNTQCISLGEGVSSDEIRKFMLTDERYVISTDGKISTNN